MRTCWVIKPSCVAIRQYSMFTEHFNSHQELPKMPMPSKTRERTACGEATRSQIQFSRNTEKWFPPTFTCCSATSATHQAPARHAVAQTSALDAACSLLPRSRPHSRRSPMSCSSVQRGCRDWRSRMRGTCLVALLQKDGGGRGMLHSTATANVGYERRVLGAELLQTRIQNSAGFLRALAKVLLLGCVDDRGQLD